jgi:WD40 repeat protein
MSTTEEAPGADIAIDVDVDADDRGEAAERALIPAREEGRFASLAALRLVHSRLLAAQDEAEGQVEPFAPGAEELLELGAATGAVLDESQDRWEAQGLLDYWYNAMYRAGRRPQRPRLARFDAEQLPSLAGVRSPYLGLAAFSENDTDLFFGRQALLETIADQLGKAPLLAVVGASGSGKSSIVRAGLIPALRSGRLLQGSASWAIPPIVLPGSTPLENLARAVIRAEAPAATPDDPAAEHPAGVDPVADLAAAMRRDPDALAARLARPGGSPVVLVIDQFEEIFTLCDEKEAVEAVFGNLLGLLRAGAEAGARPRNRIVLTMRIDFEVYILKYPEFRREFDRGRVAITPMERDELRDAIDRPARSVGLVFERGVVDKLIEDTYGEPGALPLLQFALMRLWRDRRRNKVTMESYTGLGGARLALATVADAVYDGLTTVQSQDAAKRIFLRIVRPGKGLEVTNRRLREQDLFPVGEDDRRTRAVLERLIDEGLIRRTRGLDRQDTQVEVAHEALVRNWPRLVDWLNDERAAIVDRQGWEDKVAEWVIRGRGREALLDDAQIRDAEKWMKSGGALLLGAITDLPALVKASRDEIGRRHAELARSRRYAVIAGIVAAFLLVLALASMLWYQATWMLGAIPKGLASEVTRLRAAEPDDVELRTLLAAEVVRRTPGRLTSEARQGLLDSVTQLPPRAPPFPSPGGTPVAMAVGPDGKSLALATDTRRVALYRPDDDWDGAWKEVWSHDVPDAVFSLAFSPDGDLLLAAAPDPAAVARIARAAARSFFYTRAPGGLLDSFSYPTPLFATIKVADQAAASARAVGSSVLVFEVEPRGGADAPSFVRIATKTPAASAMCSRDRRWLYYAAWNNALWRADASHLSEETPFGKVWPTSGPAVLPSDGVSNLPYGRQAADAVEDSAGPEIGRMPGCLGFSPDGRLVTFQDSPTPAGANPPKSIGFFRLDAVGTATLTPLPLSVPQSDPYGPASVQYNPDIVFSPLGEVFALALGRAFQVHRSEMLGNPAAPLVATDGLGEAARILAISPDAEYVATVADASTAQAAGERSIGMPAPGISLTGPAVQVVNPLAWGVRQAGSLGRVEVLAGSTKSVHIVRRSTGRVVARATHDGAITAAQFSPDGHHLVTAARDGSVRIWALSWGVATSHGLDEEAVQVAAFSPDRARIAAAIEPSLASGSSSRGIRLLGVDGKDAEDGGETVLPPGGPIQVLGLSPGARYVVAASVPSTPTYPLPAVVARKADSIPAFALAAQAPPGPSSTADPDALRFAIHWGDLGTGEHRTIRETGPVAAVDIHPKGDRIATSAWRSRMTLVDLAEPGPGRVTSNFSGPMAAVLSPGGDRVATVGWDNAVRLWRLAGPKLEVSAPIENPGIVSSPTFSADGRRLAYLVRSSGATAPAASTLTAHVVDGSGRWNSAFDLGALQWLSSLTLSPDGSLLATMSADGVMVRDVLTGQVLYRFNSVLEQFPIHYDPAAGRLVDTPAGGPGQGQDAPAVASAWGRRLKFSTDGRLLVIDEGGQLGVLDSLSGEVLGILWSNGAGASQFSGRGSRLATQDPAGKFLIRHLPTLEATDAIPVISSQTALLRFEEDEEAIRVAEGPAVYRFRLSRPRPSAPVGADRAGLPEIRARLVQLNHYLDTVRGNFQATEAAQSPKQQANFLQPSSRPTDVQRARILGDYLLAPKGPKGRDELLRAAGIAPGAASAADRGLLTQLIRDVIEARPEELGREKPIFRFPPRYEGFQPWALSPDGRFLTAVSDAAICRFELRSPAPEPEPEQKPDELSTWLVSDDGRVGLAMTLAAATTVRDPRDGPARMLLDGEPVAALAYSPDGRLLATGSLDRHLRLFDAGSLDQGFPPEPPHPAPIHGVAFSPTGARLATIAADQVARIWAIDRTPGPPVARFLARLEMPGPVQRMAFSHDDNYLAVAGGEGAVRVWDLSATPEDPASQRSVTFARDWPDVAIGFEPYDEMLVALSPSHRDYYAGTAAKPRLDILPWSKPALLRLAGRRVSRNLDRTEWETYLGGLPYRPTIASLPVGAGVGWRMVPNRNWQVPMVLLLAAGAVVLSLFVLPARVSRHWMDRGQWIAYVIAILVAGLIWGWLTPPMVWSDVLIVPSLIEKLTIAATLGGLATLCVWGQPKLIARYSPIATERPLEALVAWWWQVANPWLAARLDSPDDPPLGGSGRS